MGIGYQEGQAGLPIVQIELARQPVSACFYVSGQGLRSSGHLDGLHWGAAV